MFKLRKITACFYFIQVLSKSVADALAYFGDESTTETENFIKMFDLFLIA